MTDHETIVGYLCLVLAFVLSATLVSWGSEGSNAYFTDVRCGAISGSVAGVPPVQAVPYKVEPGTSKALHVGPGDDGPACGDPIARVDGAGNIHLDFGEALPKHGDSRPDVVRLVSLARDSRTVSFDVTGSMARFVTEVRLGDGPSNTLAAGATRRVFVQIRVPDDEKPGTLTGTLVIHVQGWAEDARIPMMIVVASEHESGRGAHPYHCAPEVIRRYRRPGSRHKSVVPTRRPQVPSAETTTTPIAPPFVAPTPVPTMTPVPTPTPTFDATETGSPTSTPGAAQ